MNETVYGHSHTYGQGQNGSTAYGGFGRKRSFSRIIGLSLDTIENQVLGVAKGLDQAIEEIVHHSYEDDYR